MRRFFGERAELALQHLVFAEAAFRYWLLVFPQVVRELRHWRRRATEVSDAALRRIALDALGKRGNLEGAAAFAAFAPWRHRRSVVRALVAFQVIYNHADMLAEQPSVDPVENARRLHAALLVALNLDADSGGRGLTVADYGDGGYLAEIVERCRTALSRLPSYAAVAPSAQQAAARIVAFQSLSLGAQGGLESWARRQTPPDSALEWWEIAAAAGSSLEVHALIAASASPALCQRDIARIGAAYFPWIGALHSLLDSLVDEAEDAATGQLSLVGCYRSRQDATASLRKLAQSASTRARELPGGRVHALLLAAMTCSYLAAPEASSAGAQAAARIVRASLGPLARPMLLVFKLRRLAAPRGLAPVAARAGEEATAPVRVESGERSADARAA